MVLSSGPSWRIGPVPGFRVSRAFGVGPPRRFVHPPGMSPAAVGPSCPDTCGDPSPDYTLPSGTTLRPPSAHVRSRGRFRRPADPPSPPPVASGDGDSRRTLTATRAGMSAGAGRDGAGNNRGGNASLYDSRRGRVFVHLVLSPHVFASGRRDRPLGVVPRPQIPSETPSTRPDTPRG